MKGGGKNTAVVTRFGQLAAFILTFFFSAMVVSFLSALFSSLRVVASSLATASWPSSSAQAMRVP
jgi:hypothetical protein